MNHNYSMKLGPIILYPLNEVTSEQYRVLRNNKDVCKWFVHSTQISKKQQKEWFKDYIKDEKDIMFSIHLNDNIKTFIGANAIYDIQVVERVAEYGRLAIIPQFSGKGYGGWATFALCTFAKEVLKLERLVLEVYRENQAAIKTYTKVGFKYLNIDERENGNEMFRMEKKL